MACKGFDVDFRMMALLDTSVFKHSNLIMPFQKVGHKYISDGNGFVLFDVKINDFWLDRDNVYAVSYAFDIELAPEIGRGTLDDMVNICKKGFNSVWGDFKAEGIVARPKVQLFNRKGERVITKLKLKDFTGGE